MPIKFKLTREQWQTFKTESKVGNLSWFKQVDVGPSINDFWTAMTNFDKDPSLKNLLDAQDKAKKLKSALGKFGVRKATAKELNNDAWTKIQAWRNELDEVIEQGYLENGTSDTGLMAHTARRCRTAGQRCQEDRRQTSIWQLEGPPKTRLNPAPG